MGMARGKLGEFVYARVKGQQVSRAYNKEPYNPQTSAQLYQRSLFTDAVKFYTRGRRQLGPFAVEDQKKTESDYNAVMRMIGKRGVVISKEGFNKYEYPALGDWILSKGTLQPIDVSLAETSGSTKIQMTKTGITTELQAVTTVGQLASLIIDGVDFLDGDYLTFVTINGGDPESDGIPSVIPNEGILPTKWDIKQIPLTGGSAQPLSDFGIVASLTGTTTKVLNVSPAETAVSNTIYSGTIIHSRNTKSGTRVSTQELIHNDAAKNAIAAARERAYIDAAVESWRITQQAPVISETIMQGNIAQSIAADFESAGE